MMNKEALTLAELTALGTAGGGAIGAARGAHKAKKEGKSTVKGAIKGGAKGAAVGTLATPVAGIGASYVMHKMKKKAELEKSAAWEAGVIAAMEDELDKEAGVMSFLSKGRAAVNKAGANVVGGLGKRMGTGRVGQALDMVAHQGRQQAAKSKNIARNLDNTAKRVAKAKQTGAQLTEAVGKKVRGARNPSQRIQMRKELAQTKDRIMAKARQAPQAKPTPKPGAIQRGRGILSTTPGKVGAGIGIGTLGTAGFMSTRPQQQQAQA